MPNAEVCQAPVADGVGTTPTRWRPSGALVIAGAHFRYIYIIYRKLRLNVCECIHLDTGRTGSRLSVSSVPAGHTLAILIVFASRVCSILGVLHPILNVGEQQLSTSGRSGRCQERAMMNSAADVKH